MFFLLYGLCFALFASVVISRFYNFSVVIPLCVETFSV